ncbi:MAG: 4Fe-4S dicluster domain-containing protein [Acutalibacteraceae bacterium]|nr:4Fe-4S dicluster domain-containing protein [Oscillospiraceae bacterium]
MYKISKEKLSSLFETISERTPLYMPIMKNGQSDFYLWQSGDEYCDSELNTVRSAKDLFFPQSENIISFKKEDRKITVEANEDSFKKFVLFGVRGCDLKGIEVLDKVFLAQPVDEFYAAKRDSAVIITAACSRPEETCFCRTFGVDAAAPGGDVTTWSDETELYWRPNTDKGERLTQELSGVLSECGDEKVGEIRSAIASKLEKLPLRDLSLEGWGESTVEERFDSENWEKLSESCLGCGACTFVCPTCQCYDIRDYDTGHGIKRYRCWDSCMYNDFTMMAHGTPRPKQMQRFRQRFMHKLAYFPANNGGEFSCVGCGRCIRKCPSRLNIVKVIRAFGGSEK